MSRRRRLLHVLLPGALLLLGAPPAAAFHDGGVAHCNGCHTMHNSEAGASIIPGGTAGQGVHEFLLKTARPTDTCLVCHARPGTETGYGVFGADPLTPKPQKGAGDYVFLLEDNLNDGHAGGANPIAGHQAGHNVLSDTKGIGVDPANPTSPGGSFPADQLACSSCHDPHGTTSFRLLYGANRLVKGEGGFSYAFTAPAPVALGIDLSGPPESNTNHTAYRTGVSAWCGNCHGDFHGGAARVALLHPSDDPLRAAAAGAYNAYRGTTNCIQFPGTAPGPCGNGTALTSYLALVPIQDANTWNTTTSTRGGTATSRVMCLTCHRAHASSAPNAGRWDFDVTFLADDGAESGSHALPNPYDANQRSLCNKCHQKDRYDALPNP